jgi:hypothetical protein
MDGAIAENPQVGVQHLAMTRQRFAQVIRSGFLFTLEVELEIDAGTDATSTQSVER